MIGAALTSAAVFAAVAAITFCVLYARIRRGKKHLWWETATGRSIMALGATVALLGVGSVIRSSLSCDLAGEIVLTVAYLSAGSVMVWRTIMMWRANHPPLDK